MARGDIHDPVPQSQWPFRLGERVLFIDHRHWYDAIGSVCRGTVRFYNPALERCYLLTKGRPVLNIEYGGTSVIVSVGEVASDTPAGRERLLLLIANRLTQRIADAEAVVIKLQVTFRQVMRAARKAAMEAAKHVRSAGTVADGPARKTRRKDSSRV